MNQGELAQKVNVTQAYVSKIELGEREPSYAMLELIAKTLNTSIAYLTGETDNPKPPVITMPVSGDRVETSASERKTLLSAPEPIKVTLDKLQKLPDSNARAIDVLWVPITSPDIKACCGQGNSYAEEIQWDVIGHYPIPSYMLMGYTWQTNEFQSIYVEGDSMEPRLHDGDLILFAHLTLMDGDMGVVKYRGKMLVRIVRLRDNVPVLLHALNDEYYDDINLEEDELDDFCILGKVLLRLPKPEKMTGLW